jgi:hypothetical protein
MNPKTKLDLTSKQKEWLAELITCTSYNLIRIPNQSDKTLITTTLFAGFYYDYERVTLNEYLKKYPLPQLQRLIRERK